jgi:hypothetical protein
MIPPTTIRIQGHDVAIIFDPDIGIDEQRAGQCNVNKNEIRIGTHKTLSQQHDTLIHECIEFMNYNLQLEMDHKVISAVACTFQQIFADNPVVLEWLKET